MAWPPSMASSRATHDAISRCFTRIPPDYFASKLLRKQQRISENRSFVKGAGQIGIRSLFAREVRFFHMHVVLVHGLKGWPENAWFPWLRRTLEEKGYTTEALKLPNPLFPKRNDWVEKVRLAISGPETILVGHSLGCAAILLALEEYEGPQIEQIVCVSGMGRPYLKGPVVQKVKEWTGWFTHELDFSTIKPKAKHWRVIHSTTDYVVPFREGEWLAAQLGVPIIETRANGHLIHEEGCMELPEVLHAIQRRNDPQS
ncbi:hypothetical protein GF380_05365 [Candidatus Uhrbacteria bacterium]|nr:hypothetical protein [Candidatus Uhrbacteria bacterium]MBD3284459.1 hypothetical protein [Candidatus Uhrbacteria bacterium]